MISDNNPAEIKIDKGLTLSEFIDELDATNLSNAAINASADLNIPNKVDFGLVFNNIDFQEGPLPPPKRDPVKLQSFISRDNHREYIAVIPEDKGMSFAVDSVPFGGSVTFKQWFWWEAYGYYVPKKDQFSTSIDNETPIESDRGSLRPNSRHLPFKYFTPPDDMIPNGTVIQEPIGIAQAQTGWILDSMPASRPGTPGQPGTSGIFTFTDRPVLLLPHANSLWNDFLTGAPPNTVLDRIEVIYHMHTRVTVSTPTATFSVSYYWKVIYTYRYDEDTKTGKISTSVSTTSLNEYDGYSYRID